MVAQLIDLKGVMALLRPLLLDNVPSIQQSAALAIGINDIASILITKMKLRDLVMYNERITELYNLKPYIKPK